MKILLKDLHHDGETERYRIGHLMPQQRPPEILDFVPEMVEDIGTDQKRSKECIKDQAGHEGRELGDKEQRDDHESGAQYLAQKKADGRKFDLSSGDQDRFKKRADQHRIGKRPQQNQIRGNLRVVKESRNDPATQDQGQRCHPSDNQEKEDRLYQIDPPMLGFSGNEIIKTLNDAEGEQVDEGQVD